VKASAVQNPVAAPGAAGLVISGGASALFRQARVQEPLGPRGINPG